MLLTVYPFGNSEDEEEAAGKSEPGYRGDGLGKQVHDRSGEQNHEHRSQSQRDLMSSNGDVRRNFPTALAFVFEPQYQHGQAVKCETPNHSECVGFTQLVYIAATKHDG